ADIRMMVKDMKRDGKFPCDGEVENLAVAGGALGDILTLQFLQIRFSFFLPHRDEHIADEYRRSGAPAWGPHHLTFPTWIQQILIGLWKLIGLHHSRIVARGQEVKVR